MLDWLIVGGGIHGTHHSFYLTRVKHVPPDRVRVLDPFETPLALWNQHTKNTGMAYLRSPHVGSLDRDPWSIATFARTRAGQSLAEFIPTHNRPSLRLFGAHSNWMVQKYGLDSMRVQGRAAGLKRVNGGWRVETEQGAIEARNVLLAISMMEQPLVPEWAKAVRAAHTDNRNNLTSESTIQHIFDGTFDLKTFAVWRRVVVIGGGISAAQLALALAQRQPGTVTLLMREAARVQPFDSDLCWVTSTCLSPFRDEPDFDKRRAIIRHARYVGSMPADVYGTLDAAAKRGTLTLCVGEVRAAALDADGDVVLSLTDGDSLRADRVILATGFEPQRPGGKWLDDAIQAYELSVASCGFPIIDWSLRWADGLFVSGPLAELEVGPASRNIIGARLAAEKIGRAF